MGKDEKSQTWSQYGSPGEACDGVCQIFEQKLKRENPGLRKITYEIKDLFNFVDDCPDLACMVLDQDSHTYVPHDKKWIKTQIYKHLKEQVSSS
mmetsp:Transcript_15915/g.22268  ORF Transcript_15915/g.22268 Transcript_15915/m.22268 type:complete len:94 (+) Transcript_15915:111-392(+)